MRHWYVVRRKGKRLLTAAEAFRRFLLESVAIALNTEKLHRRKLRRRHNLVCSGYTQTLRSIGPRDTFLLQTQSRSPAVPTQIVIESTLLVGK